MLELNTIHKGDCVGLMRQLPDGSMDCILTDPPYLYLKGHKLDRPFDESAFFAEAKRVLKKDGFIVLFGRGTSFYRWNTTLAEMGFKFKEEFVWDKAYCTSPLMAISRVHETISIHTKGSGVINRVKVPYLEMKGHDINAICVDLKRFLQGVKNEKSLRAVLDFIENNKVPLCDKGPLSVTISSEIKIQDRGAAVLNGIENGLNEKSIIRADREVCNRFTKFGITSDERKSGDRSVNALQSMFVGQNEKSIIRQVREHYSAIHPTQKPVRLLERILALCTKEGNTVLDPFSGSGSTAIACINAKRTFIGMEIDEEYYAGSLGRVSTHLKTIDSQTKLAI